MHGTNIKIISAQQAKICNIYKNTRLKLLKTNTAIWFNKMCKIKHQKTELPSIQDQRLNTTRQEDDI